jgi:hypothetical protein
MKDSVQMLPARTDFERGMLSFAVAFLCLQRVAGRIQDD